MLLIPWYNAIAIGAGIIFIVLFLWAMRNMSCSGTGMFAGVGDFLCGVIVLFLACIFYAIWGGIFWW